MIQVRDITIRGSHISSVAGPRKHDNLGKHKLFLNLVGGQDMELLFVSEEEAKTAHDAIINAMKGD